MRWELRDEYIGLACAFFGIEGGSEIRTNEIVRRWKARKIRILRNARSVGMKRPLDERKMYEFRVHSDEATLREGGNIIDQSSATEA